MMIPLKLALRNFMCYRENVSPLHFEGFRVACLCGDNGNGKSALIDAITWALWSKARARSDDELIHLGQREMEVEFEFIVGQNRYRIIRKRAKGGMRRAGQAILELQLATPQGFESITGNSVQETQRKIIDILRMDYETFINSALLLQGRADEFTIKPPSERKKVLADILNLSLYDELEDQAKGVAKQKEIECGNLAAGIRDIDAELANKESYQEELYQVQAALVELEAQVKRQEGVLDELRQAKKELDLKKEQQSETESRIAEAERELNYSESQLILHRHKVEDYQATLAQSTEIEEGYRELVGAKKENEELNERLRQLHALTEGKNQLEQAIRDAKNELVTEQSVLQSQLQRLQLSAEAVPGLEQQLVKIQSQSAELDNMGRELEQKRLREQELSNQIHYLKSANIKLEEEIEERRSKIEMLRRNGARCPLCESELGIEGRDRIITKYEQERQTKAETYHGNELELAQKEKDFQLARSEIAQFEARLNRERAITQGQDIALKKEFAQAQEAATELTWHRARLAEVAKRLKEGEFALEQKAALVDLDARIKSLGYDAARHHSVGQRLAEFDRYDELKRRLDEAKELIEQEKESLAWAEDRAGRWRSARDAEAERREALAQELKALPEIGTKLAEAGRVYDAVLARQAQGRKMLGAVEQKLERCAVLEKSKQEKSRALTRAAAEKGIYEELATAFGKKGIQALVIEQVLPEIEDEANRLLGRMTDSRMSVRLETQRLTKRGEPVETLDIRVSDELGTRSYEMFSGGEAFRIDFALRIALSKLLARRAGAPLPTLFIDEGFGTQDSSGREKLVEAINSIQDDFEKIIVITHIEELKDAFPVRIEVTKTAEGSMISMS
jgi:exonuclease SbcC